MSVQCCDPVEESKEEVYRRLAVDEESDEDNFSVTVCQGTVNRVDVGIQTNEAHFRKVERSEEFARRQQERLESMDWALSPIFDDIAFAKEKKTIGGRKVMHSLASQVERFENCGNQVEEKQILIETALQILSQIECEYNVD